MGVHGLSTYLRENQRKLSAPLVLSQEQLKSEVTIPLVVDGWSCVPSVGLLPNTIENDPAVSYMNFTISLACHGRMAVNMSSSVTW